MLSFSPDKLCWIHFWSDPRSFMTQWADTLRQCKALYSSFYNDAARTLETVSWVVMVTDLPRQLLESPCHIPTQQPTISPCFIWRGILPCCEHHVLLDLLECWFFVVEVENDYNGWNYPIDQKPLMINAWLRYVQEIKELKLASNTLFLGNLWKYFCRTIQHVHVCGHVCVCVCVFSHAYMLKYKVPDKTFFFIKKYWYFSNFSTKKYTPGTHRYSLEALFWDASNEFP